jgi:hypothetical protein
VTIPRYATQRGVIMTPRYAAKRRVNSAACNVAWSFYLKQFFYGKNVKLHGVEFFGNSSSKNSVL